MLLKFQRPAVLCHGVDDLVRDTTGDVGCNFERYCHIRTNETCQVRDHFIGYSAGVTSYPSGVQRDATVKPRLLLYLPKWCRRCCGSIFRTSIGLRKNEA